MSKQAKPNRGKMEQLHPGSSAQDAKAVGGKGDFGVPESDVVGRSYTSMNTKRADPGGAVARAGSDESRTSGAGGNRSGVGSSSGGDIDTDIVGVGTGGTGVSASGNIHEPPGPDDATGTSRDFASGPPAKGRRAPAGANRPRGSTVQPPDDRTVAGGADSATNAARNDDSFAGEVSSDEASGSNDAG